MARVLKETFIENYEKEGKSFYATSKKFNIKITISSNTFRIITVDKVIK
ncbi:DUF3781 domain-containing protein [Polaribacter cellanae]|uniref:DUF3781 domain-containing protein n=1 Tax=Polaribacter cellanae TaxID=2818493 RepID=A0A975CUI7_9FLAO|nr:DUF3781 domain-containing protein [Polaribacter cellanae]